VELSGELAAELAALASAALAAGLRLGLSAGLSLVFSTVLSPVLLSASARVSPTGLSVAAAGASDPGALVDPLPDDSLDEAGFDAALPGFAADDSGSAAFVSDVLLPLA
jgi:hypothetical protein